MGSFFPALFYGSPQTLFFSPNPFLSLRQRTSPRILILVFLRYSFFLIFLLWLLAVDTPPLFSAGHRVGPSGRCVVPPFCYKFAPAHKSSRQDVTSFCDMSTLVSP